MAKEKQGPGSDLLSKIEELNKRYGAGAVNTGNDIISIDRLSTGSMSLDNILGGGWGIGKIAEIYGPESSGKTTVCIHSMIEAQKSFPEKRVAFVDAEHALDRDYCEHLGLDMSKVVISQPDNGEQALAIAEVLISSGEISLCVIDSVAALVPKAEIDGDMGDSKMGLQARLMSQAMRKLTGLVNKTGTVLIFTNQLRDKIGVMYGSPETTSGGNALKFYASIRVDIRKSMGAKDGEEVLTSKVTCKTVKNKLAPPFRKCVFEIIFGEGVDKIGELVTFADELGIIDKKGTWYSYQGTNLAQGFQATKDILRDNPELAEEIHTKIYELMGK